MGNIIEKSMSQIVYFQREKIYILGSSWMFAYKECLAWSREGRVAANLSTSFVKSDKSPLPSTSKSPQYIIDRDGQCSAGQSCGEAHTRLKTNKWAMFAFLGWWWWFCLRKDVANICSAFNWPLMRTTGAGRGKAPSSSQAFNCNFKVFCHGTNLTLDSDQ